MERRLGYPFVPDVCICEHDSVADGSHSQLLKRLFGLKHVVCMRGAFSASIGSPARW